MRPASGARRLWHSSRTGCMAYPLGKIRLLEFYARVSAGVKSSRGIRILSGGPTGRPRQRGNQVGDPVRANSPLPFFLDLGRRRHERGSVRWPGDFKATGKGQRTKDLPNSLPCSRPYGPRSSVQSEGYGHPDGHLIHVSAPARLFHGSYLARARLPASFRTRWRGAPIGRLEWR